MPLVTLVPASYTRHSAAMWAILNHLITSTGFVKARGSDGVSTYVDGTPTVTGDGTGAGGYDNPKAWVVVRDPNTGRELSIQRDTSSAGTATVNFRMKYSATGFGSTGATAVVVPDNGTGQLIFGGGTDASPTFSNLINITANTCKVGCSLRYGTMGEPAGFAAWSLPNGGGTPQMFFGIDPMSDGTFSPTDPDPGVVFVSGTGVTAGAFSAGASSPPWARAWLRKGLAGEGYVSVASMLIHDGAGAIIPNAAGEDHMVGGQLGFPIPWVRRAALAAPYGVKGFSSFLRYRTSSVSSGQLCATDGVTVDGVVIGDYLVPWADVGFPL